jgi:hypothetical protein
MKKILGLVVMVGVLFVLFIATAQAQSPEWVQIKTTALTGQSNNGTRFGKDFMVGSIQYWCWYDKSKREITTMGCKYGTCYITSYNEKTRTFSGGYVTADHKVSNHPISWSEGIECGKVLVKYLRENGYIN